MKLYFIWKKNNEERGLVRVTASFIESVNKSSFQFNDTSFIFLAWQGNRTSFYGTDAGISDGFFLGSSYLW